MGMLQLVVVPADSRRAFVFEGFEKHDVQSSWRRSGLINVTPKRISVSVNVTNKSLH